MTKNPKSTPKRAVSIAHTRAIYGVAGLLLIVLAAASFAIKLANSEYQRDLKNWETRLNITADTRAVNIEKWVERQFSIIEQISEDSEVINFMQPSKKKSRQDISQELSSLKLRLTAYAKRGNFQKNPSNKVDSNTGIVIVDQEGYTIVATDELLDEYGDLSEELSGFIWRSSGKEIIRKDIFLEKNGKAAIAFLAPVYGKDNKRLGVIIGVKSPLPLYEQLQLPKLSEKTSESLLVREKRSIRSGGIAEYISPLKDGSPPLEYQLNMDRADFTASFAMKNPHKIALLKDYKNTDVIATGRKINGTLWTLIHKVNKDEALAESDERRSHIIAICLLAIGFLVVVILAVWYRGTTVHLAEAVAKYKELSRKFQSQEKLLRLVADNQPDAMFIIDEDDTCRFANLQAARFIGRRKEDLINETLTSLFGEMRGSEYKAINDKVLSGDFGTLSQIKRLDNSDESRTLNARHIPLDHIPDILSEGDAKLPGVLIVEEDITALISERERRERLLKQLVDSLVTAVDCRDPFAARHSERVAALAESVAIEMHLEDLHIETAKIAGTLMNLGKLLAPRELLVSDTKLSSQDKERIVESLETSADFLEGIEFDGPVVDTIRQAQEHWDGSGPLGLKEDNILITARIIVVANSFVAMSSHRAYRSKMKNSEIIEAIMSEIGTKYDRKVVVAFVNYIENNEESV